MILNTLLAVTVSMLAVFGLWCAIKLASEAWLTPRCMMTAIEITNEKDAEMLDVLLQQAHSAFFRKTKGRTVVLISAGLLQGCLGTDGVPDRALLELLARFGAIYRIID